MATLRRPRIGLLLPRYSRRSRSLMPVIVEALRASGAHVDIIHPVDKLDLSRVRVEHDIYVLRHTSGLSLSLAGALHALGAVIVNPYPVSATLRDKIITTRILQAAGVPIPDTYVAATPLTLAQFLESGPLVIKPYQGTGGRGVVVVNNEAELASVNCDHEPVFAQRYQANDGRDRKIYAIGGRLFGVRKVFPRRTEEEKIGERFTLTPHLRQIAEQCAAAFDLDLYGIDVIESDDGAYVVDVCSIPGFKGVPDATRLLTEYFLAAARRAAGGQVRGYSSPVTRRSDGHAAQRA